MRDLLPLLWIGAPCLPGVSRLEVRSWPYPPPVPAACRATTTTRERKRELTVPRWHRRCDSAGYSGHPANEVGSVHQRSGCSYRPPRWLAGHLAGLLASGIACHNVYQDLSDCILKLGENMATYEEADGIELQGLHHVCG